MDCNGFIRVNEAPKGTLTGLPEESIPLVIGRKYSRARLATF